MLFFALCMGAMAAIGGAAFTLADPSALIYGHTSDGHRCGVGAYAASSQTYYPHLASEIAEQRNLLLSSPWEFDPHGVCVRECPSRGGVRDADGHWWDVAESTMSVLNRCMPVKEEKASRTVACTDPTCRQVIRPFRIAVGLLGRFGAHRPTRHTSPA